MVRRPNRPAPMRRRTMAHHPVGTHELARSGATRSVPVAELMQKPHEQRPVEAQVPCLPRTMEAEHRRGSRKPGRPGKVRRRRQQRLGDVDVLADLRRLGRCRGLLSRDARRCFEDQRTQNQDRGRSIPAMVIRRGLQFCRTPPSGRDDRGSRSPERPRRSRTPLSPVAARQGLHCQLQCAALVATGSRRSAATPLAPSP
jgi:hypothetical protein